MVSIIRVGHLRHIVLKHLGQIVIAVIFVGRGLVPKINNTDNISIFIIGVTITVLLFKKLDAIKKDCEAGNMAQNWAYHEEFDKEMNSYNVEFRANDIMIPHVLNWNSRYFHLTVYNDSSNTIAYLESMLQLHQEELPEDQPILDPLPE